MIKQNENRELGQSCPGDAATSFRWRDPTVSTTVYSTSLIRNAVVVFECTFKVAYF